MFLSKWFNQASEIETLRRQLSSKESDLATERWRVEQLEKQILAERKGKDKFVLDYANACSKMIGLKPMFSEVHEKKEAHQSTDTYSEQENQQFEWMAKEMRDADIANDIDVPDLQTYVNLIKSNPTQYKF